MALLQRRVDLLEPLRQILNPNSYYNLLQEMSAELSEIYSNKFDLIYEPIQQGIKKLTKKSKEECNEACWKSIEHSKFVCETIYKSEDKFEYVQPILNMELQAASRLTKIYYKDT